MLDLKSLSVWIEGLINAAISGGTVALTTIVLAPQSFNLSGGFGNLVSAFGISAGVSIAKYMARNPIKIFVSSEIEIQKGSVSVKVKGKEEGDTAKETLKDLSDTAVTTINKVYPQVKQIDSALITPDGKIFNPFRAKDIINKVEETKNV